MRFRPASRRPAVVLLAVLVVVVLLSLAAYKYSELMEGEYRAASSGARTIQARALAESGIAYASALLASDTDGTLGGNLWDNPTAFSGIAVPNDNPRDAGQFHIVSLSTPDDQARPYRPGITDECGKINLNALLRLDGGKGEMGYKMLMALPNMTAPVANAILDWLDSDDTPREGGAENTTYGTMDPPYRCKNGPLDSLEELLLVQGVTPELLFGGDRNRNGTLDSDEGGGGEVAGQGWAAFLTVYSREVNVSSTGAQRINLNNKDLNKLKSDLQAVSIPEDTIQYILACRLYGTSTTSSSSAKAAQADITALSDKIAQDMAKSSSGKSKIRSLWDLANTQVKISTGTGKSAKTVIVPSPLLSIDKQRSDLPAIFDNCALNEKKDSRPRINVLSAPNAVIAALGQAAGLTDTDVASIQTKRPALTESSVMEPRFKTPVWLLTEAGLPVATVKKLDRFVTSRSQVYRFQVLGVFDRGGPSARVEAVLDTNQGRPRLLYWRDLSELGRGFDIRPEAAK